jgi:hypothetical protein
MLKTLALLALTLLVLILPLTSLALHFEAFVRNGFSVCPGQFSFPTVLFPAILAKGHGISWGACIAAGVAMMIHEPLFMRFVVKRWKWVTEDEVRRAKGIKDVPKN